jgi:hypothetical protein
MLDRCWKKKWIQGGNVPHVREDGWDHTSGNSTGVHDVSEIHEAMKKYGTWNPTNTRNKPGPSTIWGEAAPTQKGEFEDAEVEGSRGDATLALHQDAGADLGEAHQKHQRTQPTAITASVQDDPESGLSWSTRPVWILLLLLWL